MDCTAPLVAAIMLMAGIACHGHASAQPRAEVRAPAGVPGSGRALTRSDDVIVPAGAQRTNLYAGNAILHEQCGLGERSITVVLPDGQRHVFDLTVSPASRPLMAIRILVDTAFVPRGGGPARLEITGQPLLFTGDLGRPGDLVDDRGYVFAPRHLTFIDADDVRWPTDRVQPAPE